MMEKFINKIKHLKDQNLYRKLINCDFLSSVIVKKDNQKLTCFASNDYLGLANHEEVKKAAIDATKKFGTGAKASRYICGNNELHQKLQNQIAKINNCQDAIIFSSGYQAAIGTIPALVDKNDLIIADKLIHASLIDGSKLSGAKLIRFKHNDICDAQKLLQESRANHKNCLIVTESVFSMDGDLGKTAELKDLATKFDCQILIDYAHSLYKKPKNSILEKGENVIKMGTFSKAIGSFGGYICSSEIVTDYLRNFARSAIYTTALPPSILAASSKSLEIIEKENLAAKTLENAKHFCEIMQLKTPESAIVIIEIDDNKKVLEIAKTMEDKGFLISAIRPPTVAKSRLRITFSASHNKDQIAELAQNLKEIL